MAQLEAEAAAVERLNRAHDHRTSAPPTTAPVSPGQLQLVVNE